MNSYKAMLLYAVLLVSCNRSNEQHSVAQNTKENIEPSFSLNGDELHLLVNGLLLSDSIDVDPDLVVLRTDDVRKLQNRRITASGDTIIDDTTFSPPWEFRYNMCLFESLAKQGYLDSAEAVYMFEQITPNLTVTLDSAKLARRGIGFERLNSFFTDKSIASNYKRLTNGYKKLEEETGAKNYIILSTPVLNKNKTKALISVNGYCGKLCGGGTLYLLEKVNGKWQVIYMKHTFIS
ncbi:hypothetical protein I2I11_14070 [Pontibacter sp. 172403-2]|uniref:hypothetical protein n=1 Tax=Pontibacter rufus TaxID=2791028 RepID=UPI0018AFCA1C|nr:hypothetical protein [Pontibacter sp. 172403-2]MBF9254426.1 hypothetical protein [Pontibacter sp. 172403-2]